MWWSEPFTPAGVHRSLVCRTPSLGSDGNGKGSGSIAVERGCRRVEAGVGECRAQFEEEGLAAHGDMVGDAPSPVN